MAQASKDAKRVASVGSIIPPYFDNRLNLVPEELEPDNLRQALQWAAMGDISQLQNIYVMMEADSRYSGIVNSLKSSVAMCPVKRSLPKTASPRAGKKALALTEEMFGRMNLVSLIKKLTKPYFTGPTLWENQWALEESSVDSGRELVYFKGVRMVPGSRYLMDMRHESLSYGELLISSMDDPEGTYWKTFNERRPGSVTYADDGCESGQLDMAGVARKCVGWWLSKVYTQTYWTQFNETFAEPTRLAFMPPGSGDDEKRKMENLLRFMGRNLYGIFEDDVEVQLLESIKTGTVTTYKELINLANAEMAVAVHGQVQTVDGGEYGSYAKAQVQFKVRREIIMLICAMVEQILKEITHQFCKFNIDEDFDPSDIPISKPLVPRSEDRKTLAEFFDIATEYTDVSETQIREELELKEIEDGEKTVGPSTRSRESLDKSRNRRNNSSERSKEDRESDGDGGKESNRTPSQSGAVSEGWQYGLFDKPNLDTSKSLNGSRQHMAG